MPAYLAQKQDRGWLEKFEKATSELMDACLEEGGCHYLTFDALASKEQFRRAYPQAGEFFSLKRRYDPREIFSSHFYEKYRE